MCLWSHVMLSPHQPGAGLVCTETGHHGPMSALLQTGPHQCIIRLDNLDVQHNRPQDYNPNNDYLHIPDFLK